MCIRDSNLCFYHKDQKALKNESTDLRASSTFSYSSTYIFQHPLIIAEVLNSDYFCLRHKICLLYTSDAADEEDSVDFGGRLILQKKKYIIQLQTTPTVNHQR
eukprot:TRINITY_DN9054_c0_g1_i2.p1 TRINITY_DN9054_c0_g1~~TRINITY_DN9054_c0_g1_i2.p1  ORF type:complete len:103 (-),score=7.36 TRINITY_DN9054_c0_g1_i2:54-362(-)